MDTTAIRQAIKLYQQPVEMAEFMSVNASLPSGITDLLRLCASEKKLEAFSLERDVNPEMLYNILTHFIEKVLFKEGNTPCKILGVENTPVYSDTQLDTDQDQNQSAIYELARQHYKLLMRIYHPDRNRSSSSSFYASKISRAYNAVKRSFQQDSSNSDGKQRCHAEPPQSFFHASRKAQRHRHRTRNALYGFAAILCVMIIGAIFVNTPDSSDLIVRNPVKQPPNAQASIQTQQDAQIKLDDAVETVAIPIQTAASDLINHAHFTTTSVIHSSGQVSASKMQVLLHELETAYEKGEVNKIKPILANAPEMQNQSDATLSAKLEALFKITRQRKMVLYDFNWQNIAGKIQGKGKFLSRFLLSGQDEWQTRTGVAIIKANIDHKQVTITRLDMQDQPEEQ